MIYEKNYFLLKRELVKGPWK